MTNALKVHLRVFDIYRTTLRVVSLRPQTGVRFSSNYFHDAWHILGDSGASSILGRLLWGLSFQRQRGTLVLIDRDHLVPTPFEADPADPILLVPDGLTCIDIDILRALKLRLRRCPGSPTTIRWHTFGMPAALEAKPDRRFYRTRDGRPDRERMSKRAGFICYTAPPHVMRANALRIFRTSTYIPLAEGKRGRAWYVDGEYQVIDHFMRDVSAAKVARREIIGADRALATEDERARIYKRKEQVLRRSSGATCTL
jgi:hypothetical protein